MFALFICFIIILSSPFPGSAWNGPHARSALMSAMLTHPPSRQSSLRVSYGAECNETTRCDARSWLTCLQGKCACLKPDEMVFEEGQNPPLLLGKCAARAGERCKYTLGDSELSLYELPPCVQNSHCSEEGICACDSAYYETNDGLCTPAMAYGETCNDEVKCSIYKGLTCQDGRCDCELTTSVYDAEALQCVGLAEAPCINQWCTPRASCIMGICLCDEGFYREVGTGVCIPKIPAGGSCSGDYQCEQKPLAELKCVGGTCACDPADSVYATVYPSTLRNWETHSFYGYDESDGNRTICVPLAGQPCIQRLCAPRAFCVYNTSSYYYGYQRKESAAGTCHCKPGLIQSSISHCGHGFGKNCNWAEDCIEGLVCKNLRCDCPIHCQSFREEAKSCFSPERGPCRRNGDCGDHAHCESFNTAGHCTCDKGYLPNGDGTCEVAFGGECTDKPDCDSVAGLDCINNICQCGGFALFDEGRRACLGKVGAACNPEEENDCVENAHCYKPHPKLPGTCICNTGTLEMEDYTCSAPMPTPVPFSEMVKTAPAPPPPVRSGPENADTAEGGVEEEAATGGPSVDGTTQFQIDYLD